MSTNDKNKRSISCITDDEENSNTSYPPNKKRKLSINSCETDQDKTIYKKCFENSLDQNSFLVIHKLLKSMKNLKQYPLSILRLIAYDTTGSIKICNSCNKKEILYLNGSIYKSKYVIYPQSKYIYCTECINDDAISQKCIHCNNIYPIKHLNKISHITSSNGLVCNDCLKNEKVKECYQCNWYFPVFTIGFGGKQVCSIKNCDDCGYGICEHCKVNCDYRGNYCYTWICSECCNDCKLCNNLLCNKCINDKKREICMECTNKYTIYCNDCDVEIRPVIPLSVNECGCKTIDIERNIYWDCNRFFLCKDCKELNTWKCIECDTKYCIKCDSKYAFGDGIQKCEICDINWVCTNCFVQNIYKIEDHQKISDEADNDKIFCNQCKYQENKYIYYQDNDYDDKDNDNNEEDDVFNKLPPIMQGFYY